MTESAQYSTDKQSQGLATAHRRAASGNRQIRRFQFHLQTHLPLTTMPHQLMAILLDMGFAADPRRQSSQLQLSRRRKLKKGSGWVAVANELYTRHAIKVSRQAVYQLMKPANLRLKAAGRCVASSRTPPAKHTHSCSHMPLMNTSPQVSTIN